VNPKRTSFGRCSHHLPTISGWTILNGADTSRMSAFNVDEPLSNQERVFIISFSWREGMKKPII
jgi:hypothetical protein